jgi:hypothetical protein
MANPRINGLTWRSIGSDADWVNYGGTWARPLGNGYWAVIRFDKVGFEGGGYTCSGGIVHPEDVEHSDLKSCDMDESAPVDDRLYAAAMCGGYLTYNVDGEHPFQVRADVARALV